MLRMIRLLNLVAGLLFCWTLSPAQSFEFRANLPRAKQTGYYRILLPPAVVGRLNDAKTDLRLYNDRKQEIPYLLKQQEPVQHVQFHEYELISKTSTRNSTRLILRNRNPTPINSLGLLIKNTNIRKKARLSGSSDAKTWYGIEDDYWLEPVASSATTSEAKLLGFPLSDYEYYQLEISDSLSAPLNILKVGYYTTQPETGQYTEIPGITFTQRDSSDHRSYVYIRFQSPARPDRLTLSVLSPTQYRRSATVAHRAVRETKRNRFRSQFQPIQSFEINSTDSLHTVYVPNQSMNELYLTIDNQNNSPLRLGVIKAEQVTTYLLAELKPDESYHLAFSNPAVSAPVYDLAYFKDKIPANLPVVQVDEPEPALAAIPATSSFFTQSWLIWAALILVILLLSYLSYRMINDMNRR